MPKAKFSVENSEKQRLDEVIASQLSITRSQAKKWIEHGFVQLNGERIAKAGTIVKAGDEIIVDEPDAENPTAVNEPLEIIFENAEMIITNKPAGICTHPDANHRTDSLLQRVLAYTPLSSVGLPDRPGVIHRLDKDTSGLVIFAKTDAAHHQLTNIFAERKIVKHYLTMVHGGSKLPNSGTIEAPLSRNARDRKKMNVSASDNAKHAISHFTVLKRLPSATVLDVKIETGRTHQIRVHFSAIGHPVVGDAMYGNLRLDASLEKSLGQKIPRMILHAQNVDFILPRETNARSFTAKVPEDIRPFLA